jgi:lysophospholipid acyltransferase (LPLAT)-like uncharacterized protein
VSHKEKLYTTISAMREDCVALQNLNRLAELIEHAHLYTELHSVESGRNYWTRTVDAIFHFARHRIPMLHFAGASISALLLCLYTQLVALTTSFRTSGGIELRQIPAPCVITVWHGCAPSLLVTIAARKLPKPVAILIADDPRGDCLSMFCRWLGLTVVRSDGEGKGWQTLARLAKLIEQGVCVLITPDGWGNARQAKVGAVALASATAKPLIAVGADCRPALFERHKWDKARNPVPFGCIAVAAQDVSVPAFIADANALEQTRLRLQEGLDRMTVTATHTLNELGKA